MKQRFEDKGSHNLQTQCDGFTFINNLLKPREDGGFFLEYIENGSLRLLSLGKYEFFDNDNIIRTPLLDNEDFFFIERKDIKLKNSIILVSDKYGVGISLPKHQFHDDFFQNFLKNYDECIRHNVHTYSGY